MLKQRTLKTAIKTTGVGVHTGARVDLGLRPAPADSGIVFNRTDLPQAVAIPALAANVGDTRLSSTLKRGGTNADDITDVLRDLPVTLMKEATSATWRREAEVVKEQPALIVIHRSAFFTFPDSMADDLYPLADNKLVAFLGYVATLNPETKFIIYSRHSWEADGAASKWRAETVNRFPVLAGRIETWRVPLDRATFRNPLTGQELRATVERALGFKSGPAAQD